MTKFYLHPDGYQQTEQELDGVKLKPDMHWDFNHYEAGELFKCSTDLVYFTQNYFKTQSKYLGPVLLKLFPYQEKLLKCFQDNKLSIAMLSRQCGKALDIETDIPTSKGWKKLKEIKVGDILFGQNGLSTNVTYITDTMYNHDVYAIKFDNNQIVNADREHLWEVINKFNQKEILTTEQIIQRNEKFRIKCNKPIYFNRPEKRSYHVMGLNHNEKMKFLNQYLKKTDYDNGYFEHHKTDFVKFISELLCSLGIKNTLNGNIVHFSKTRLKNDNGFFEVLDHIDDYYHIVSIEKIESVPVRCLQVDNEDHLFLCTRSMIPTHNTTLAAAFILWWAMFKDEQNILVASKDQDAADEIISRLWYAYEELPWFLKPGVRKNDVKTKIFTNRTRIKSTATTPGAGRGKTNNLIYIDEFAFIRDTVAEPFWTSIFPTISGSGHCIISSTPQSDEGKFAKLWFNARPHKDSEVWNDTLVIDETKVEKVNTIFENSDIEKIFKKDVSKIRLVNDDENDIEFVSFFASWRNVPTKLADDGSILSYQDDSFKKMMQASGVDDEKWEAEFECQFISTEPTLISGAKLAVLNKHVQQPRFIDRWGCRWYDPIKPNATYSVILDPSGDGGFGDDAAIQVFELPTLKQVAEWNTNKADQDEQARMLKRILQRIYLKQIDHPDYMGVGDLYYSVERTGLGIGIIRIIEMSDETTFPGTFIDSSVISGTSKGNKIGGIPWNRHRGLNTSAATKKRFAQELKSLIERNLFIPRSEFLISQLKSFVRFGTSYRAKSGMKDDIVMSCILQCHMIEELKHQIEDLDDYVAPDVGEIHEDHYIDTDFVPGLL